MSFMIQMIDALRAFIFSKNIFLLAAGIVGVGFIIAFHELGHFIFCKIFKIRTPSFSIGMGPKIITKHIAGTDFSISAIPLGGYVEIANAPEDGFNVGDTSEYFANKPYWQKMLVMSGGIFFNLIFAYIVFTLLFMSGMPDTALVYPENADPIIKAVGPDAPAAKAGLLPGDKILALEGNPINGSVAELTKAIQARPGETITIDVERNGTPMVIKATIGSQKLGGSSGQSLGYLGLEFQTHPLAPTSLGSAVSKGIALTHFVLGQTLSIFKWMFKERHIKGLGGPIMIFSQTVQHAERGIKIFLAFLAIISINLAVLNLIPLPILDGGQALFATIEAIIRRQLPGKIKEYIMLITWACLIALTLYLSFKDISIIRSMKSATTEVTEQEKNN